MITTENTTSAVEGATTNPAAPGVVTLDTPLSMGSRTVTHVSVRRPLSGELRGVQLSSLLQMDVAALQMVLPRITAPVLTRADVDRLDPADLVQIGTEVINFLLPKADRALASPSA